MSIPKLTISSAPKTDLLKDIPKSYTIRNLLVDLYYVCLKPFIELLKEGLQQGIRSFKAKILILNHSILKIKNIFQSNQRKEISPVTIERPLFIRNIGNSCYLSSVLQVLLSLKEIREKLEHPKKNELIRNPSKEIICKQLRRILKWDRQGRQEEIEPSLLALLFPSLDHRPMANFRNALFASELNRVEFPPQVLESLDELEMQKDAASVLELLMHDVFGYAFQIQKVAYSGSFSGSKVLPLEFHSVLQIPLHSKATSLEELIAAYSDVETICQAEKPVEVRTGLNGIKPGKQEANIKNTSALEQNLYKHHQMQLKSLPPILALHLKRFKSRNGVLEKVGTPVKLPENGWMDLSKWYHPNHAKLASAQYELAGYVVHSGSLNGGHYTACVKIEDRFFACNDLQEPPFQPITKAEFYGNENAYLLVFKERKQMESVIPKKYNGLEPIS